MVLIPLLFIPLLFISIPILLGLLLSPEAPARWIIGLLLGAYGFASLTNLLNTQFGFYPSSTRDFFSPAVMMVGALLGSTTGVCVLLNRKESRLGVGVGGLVVATLMVVLYSCDYLSHLHSTQFSPAHQLPTALAGSGPGLLWSGTLFLRGVWLMREGLGRHAGTSPPLPRTI